MLEVLDESTMEWVRTVLENKKRYFENIEENEFLSADWEHDYYRGMKAGAIRTIELLLKEI